MDKITDKLVADLAQYAKERRTSPTIDNDLRDDVLDHAFDTLGFEGDEEDLWAAVVDKLNEKLFRPDDPKPAPRRDVERIPPAWNLREDGDIATSPYRFVPLNETVSVLGDAPTSHAIPRDNGLSCVLDVEWAVETPLLIGETDGQAQEPFTLGDTFAIPGATLRGAIRSVTEVHAFGRLFQVGRHKRFALRDFEHPEYRRFVAAGQGEPGLQAGWLLRINNAPHIQPCGWGYVPIPSILGSTQDSVVRDWVKSDRKTKYRNQGIDWQGQNAFSETRGFDFKGKDKGDRPLFEPAPAGRQGTLVFSGAVPMGRTSKIIKKFEYVFFATTGDPVPISETAWETFQITNCKTLPKQERPGRRVEGT